MNADLWKAPSGYGEAEKAVADTLSISGVTAGMLVKRGYSTPGDCLKFLYPSIEDISDPSIMKDMDRAVSVIRNAVSRGKKILIYGDFDADGITASAILVRSFRENGIHAEYYIPHRINEGYGLNEEAIEASAKSGTGLIITVDCGITSLQEVIKARRLGIEVVITDHHEPSSIALPPAHAIVDPMQSGCGSPYKQLSGAGVALKLSWALFGKETAMRHMDLAAIGTVADVCPLTGENRVIVKQGMEQLSRAEKPGIALLLENAGTNGRSIDARTLSFVLGPRLNAPGRLDSACSSVEILITEDREEAAALSASIESDNRRRRKLQKTILESAMKKLGSGDCGQVIALSDDLWHPGLIGIIASKISELHSRPAVLISSAGEYARGSARSIEGFHILSALSECKSALLDLGGHAMAAGFSASKKNVPRLIKKIRRMRIDREEIEQRGHAEVDRAVQFPEITMKLLNELELMEPFGEGNPEPALMTENVKFSGIRKLKNSHLRMKAASGGRSFDCIGFGMFSESIFASSGGHIIYAPEINEWNGRRSIQLKLKGIKTVE